jgi:hypothetical protein
MTANDAEVLSAFFDGAAVDPEQLAEALADPDAPQWLVTCARLRAEIQGDTSRPSPAFYERMRSVLEPRWIQRFFRAGRAVVPWPVMVGMAPALLLAGLGVGVWLGAGASRPLPPPTPAPTIAEQTAPVTAAPPSTPGPSLPSQLAVAPPSREALTPPAPRTGPPQPKHVLRFARPGEWHEGL